MNKFYKIIFLAFALSACAVHQNPLIDLDFMHDQIVKNHPGMYNSSDSLFKDELEKAYLKAHNEIASSSYSDQQKLVLTLFAKSFDDAHVWVSWTDIVQNTPRKQQNQRFTIKHVNPKMVWITLPTFDIKSDQKKDFERILQQLQHLKNRGKIVFDLRGNQGGNSEYGDQIVNRLFGESYTNQQRRIANRNIFVDWRASSGNLKHMREMHARYKSDWMSQVADCIEVSIDKQEPYCHVAPADKAPNKPFLSHNVTAKIVVIIESRNVSSALDFIDSLKMMRHPVMLIGKTTKADRFYMEVRTVDLPSGTGTFSYPIKVYRNRPRGDNVPYVPDFECDIDNTEHLEKYVESME